MRFEFLFWRLKKTKLLGWVYSILGYGELIRIVRALQLKFNYWVHVPFMYNMYKKYSLCFSSLDALVDLIFPWRITFDIIVDILFVFIVCDSITVEERPSKSNWDLHLTFFVRDVRTKDLKKRRNNH